MAKSNTAIVQQALQREAYEIGNRLRPNFLMIANDLIKTAIEEKSFTSFTGNTITSIAAGIYIHGKLDSMVLSKDSLQSPIMIKIMKGQAVYLETPYEGQERWVKGRVDATQEYGFETSVKFLQGFIPTSGCPISLVLTTGTEYSEFLGDFFTNTRLATPAIVRKNIHKVN